MLKTIELNSSAAITAIQSALNKSTLGADLAPYIPTAKDGVWVAYRDSSGNLIADPWSGWGTTRTDALGVVVIEGTKRLVVALDEAQYLAWGSADGAGGATTATSKDTADADMDGKSNTSKIVASATYKNDGAAYAPGYCAAYSKTDPNGNGIAAGSWWLPSLGEIGIIWKHFERINAALGRIQGATLIRRTYYWSSTEHSASKAWRLSLGNGNRHPLAKTEIQNYVRPVTSF